jgi:hypothetical protein
MGSRLATALHWFWRLRGPVSEGRHWMDSVLADGKDASPTVHAALLARAGDLAMIQGDFARAVALQEASVALARKLDDRHSSPTRSAGADSRRSLKASATAATKVNSSAASISWNKPWR